LGKGITTAALGCLMKARGYRVGTMKFDPYINIDPSVMSPSQHGEVFVTDDGAETDLDVGHYERFTDENLTANSSISVGKIYWEVLQGERDGKYGGDTVQVIPHITDAIKDKIKQDKLDKRPDIVICEVGGTVGDIEGLPFIEAIRQFRGEDGANSSVLVHVTLLPYLPTSGELKTKPSQHSVNTLRSYGLQPEILVCRTQMPIPTGEKDKIALFCSVQKDSVIECRDMSSIYEVPLALEQQDMANIILKRLGMSPKKPNLDSWLKLVNKIKNPKKTVRVALVGKYLQLSDAYLSIVEALNHAGYANDAKIEVKWLAPEECLDYTSAKALLEDVQALVVPGGFGSRGIEGKLNLIRHARENNLPFLGICLGAHCAVVEFARNVAGLENANSKEFDEHTPYPVVDLMLEQKGLAGYNTTRLGACECTLKDGSRARKIYGSKTVKERHRHRYEINTALKEQIEAKGLVFSGSTPDGLLSEIVEYPKNDFFIGCQFNPEFKSRPEEPHPLFLELVKCASNRV
jgi:CTP synthase